MKVTTTAKEYTAYHSVCGSDEVFYREESVSYVPIVTYVEKDKPYAEPCYDGVDTECIDSRLWCSECCNFFHEEELAFKADDEEVPIKKDPYDDL